jgi:hypothetical protein
MNPERRPAVVVVEMRFAQMSYGSVDSDAPASSACRLLTAHDAVKLFSLVPNELKWLQREPV